MTKDEQKCENCYYSVERYGSLRCAKNAPRAMSPRDNTNRLMAGMPTTASFYVFPRIEADNWCGEWRHTDVLP